MMGIYIGLEGKEDLERMVWKKILFFFLFTFNFMTYFGDTPPPPEICLRIVPERKLYAGTHYYHLDILPVRIEIHQTQSLYYYYYRRFIL